MFVFVVGGGGHRADASRIWTVVPDASYQQEADALSRPCSVDNMTCFVSALPTNLAAIQRAAVLFCIIFFVF